MWQSIMAGLPVSLVGVGIILLAYFVAPKVGWILGFKGLTHKAVVEKEDPAFTGCQWAWFCIGGFLICLNSVFALIG